MTVLDIGANIGAHTLYLGSLVGSTGRVYAVEPTEWAFRRLVENLSLNPDLEKIINCYGVGLKSEKTSVPKSVYSSWALDQNSEIFHGGILKSTVGANFYTLDQFSVEFCEKSIDFIKIDVDGLEIDILKSGYQLLKNKHPMVLMELCPDTIEGAGSSLLEFVSLMTELDYKIYHELTFKNIKLNVDEIKKLVPKKGSINILCKYL